ncbi:hypothetical protein CsSME_00028509 [Camellia sinensis var. sinensis]
MQKHLDLHMRGIKICKHPFLLRIGWVLQRDIIV